MIRILLLLFLCTLLTNSFSQSLPILLDGKTDEWNIPVPTYIDDIGDGNIFDFRYFSVTNDEDFLFIRLNLLPENKLVEDNLLTLYIDGDDNSGTGVLVNGIGAELRWDFGFRNGTFYKNGQTFISFPEIQYRSLPTVTDTTYEIAIGRNVLPNGSDQLFTSSTIKIFFKDNVINGDWMPNNGEVFEYSFDDTPTPPIDLIEINREDNSYLRIMNYNILFDGLLDPAKEQYFTRILQAIQPDIICFNEFFDSDAIQVQSKINEMLPLPNGASWNAVKLDQGNVTVTKYPIIQSWEVFPGRRETASLIELPERFEKNIMVINSHYKCCGGSSNDNTRQLEADATIAFILDAKTPGGLIDLPQGTPYLILGDLNLVGDRQQLTTLITGEIINTPFFGNGGPPDWDESDLEDMISQQTDKRTAYTWRNDNSLFPPGRLDFQIYSNSVMSVEKSFVIQTEIMSADRLTQYGLQQFDTRNASDHFPKITDYSFNVTSVTAEDFQPMDFKLEQNYPNPFNPSTSIQYAIGSKQFVRLRVFDVLGKEVATLVNEELSAGSYKAEFNASDLISGIYFYELQAGRFVETKKMILLR
ncbi:MAG: T9SS type A sorting domain-containing protein [Ignavibacteria bacterium]|nr:T9SS type A sorting domain-containing protein [Ignavibacteria bacterium]